MDIEIINNLTKNLIFELKNGNLDILMLNLPNEYEKEIKIIPCKEVNDTFIVSSEYAKKIPDIINISDLNNYPLILQKGPSNTRNFINNFMLENKTILKPKIEIVSYGLVLEFTKIGLGIGYATKQFAQKEIDDGSLIEIKTLPKIPPRQIGIAVLNSEHISFATKKLISIITDD